MGKQASVWVLHQEDGEEGLGLSSTEKFPNVCVMERTGQKWEDISRTIPDLASYVKRRFAAHEHHVIATIRRDGSPRVSGTNVMFTNGTLWIGMMPHALRTLDLRLTQYCALHSAPLNVKLPTGEGDVRLNAVARELSEAEAKTLLAAHFPDADSVMPGNFFELLPTDFSVVEVVEDKINITRWSPTEGVSVTHHQ